MNFRVAADPRFPNPEVPFVSVVPDRRDDVRSFLERGGETVVAWGDDRLVSALAEGIVEMGLNVAIVPMPIGAYRTVWRASGLPGKPRRVLKLLHKGRVASSPTPTLRIVESGRGRAAHGFSFGAGLVFNIFEGHALREVPAVELVARRAPALLRELSTRGPTLLNAVDGRLNIDWGRVSDGFAYLFASSLEESWLEVPMAEATGPGVRFGDAASGLLTELSRVGRVIERVSGGSRTFDRIHMDARTGYVIDGRLFPFEAARIVEISPGPRVSIARA